MQARYIDNSLAIHSPEMDQIKAAARDHSIAVVLGFSERTLSRSVYISQATISPQGEVLMHRRKLKPTHMERTIFGDGSGRDLANVVEIDFGSTHGAIKVGTLACWEHTQPLLKYHTISLGETIHVAMWPPIAPSTGVQDPGLWSMSAEGCLNLSQTYAIESAAYVVHATAVCNQESIATMRTQDGIVCRQPGGGHSCVIAPDGRRLTDPLGDGTGVDEGIVYADLDMARTTATKGFLDIVGHYSRPDLLWLGVDRRQKEVVVAVGSSEVVDRENKRDDI
jgi:predicted amidohydrolase